LIKKFTSDSGGRFNKIDSEGGTFSMLNKKTNFVSIFNNDLNPYNYKNNFTEIPIFNTKRTPKFPLGITSTFY
jgi:hypothetical protein